MASQTIDNASVDAILSTAGVDMARARADIASVDSGQHLTDVMTLARSIGQPATVLLTSIEVLKDTPNIDAESRRQVEDMCYAAVLDLRQCLKDMNAARMSVKGSMAGGHA